MNEEHIKSMIEMMEGTKEVIEGYAEAKGLSFSEASQALIFNELRCIHWHFDEGINVKKNGKKIKI